MRKTAIFAALAAALMASTATAATKGKLIITPAKPAPAPAPKKPAVTLAPAPAPKKQPVLVNAGGNSGLIANKQPSLTAGSLISRDGGGLVGAGGMNGTKGGAGIVSRDGAGLVGAGGMNGAGLVGAGGMNKRPQ